MLNFKNKNLTKIISIALIQAFFFTGILYPDSINSSNNKDITSIYGPEMRLRVPMANSGDSRDTFRERFDGSVGVNHERSQDILLGRLDNSIIEKKAGKFSLDEGVDEIIRIVQAEPGKKKLILINGNQRSGKTIFTLLLIEKLGVKNVGRVDEDKHQIDHKLRGVSKKQLAEIQEELLLKLDTNGIVIYDGINSYKVFRKLQKDLLIPYVQKGMEVINISLDRNSLSSEQDMFISYLIDPSFADMTHRIKHYPVIRDFSEKRKLIAISNILDSIKDPIVVMLDIDETLIDAKSRPKIKNLKNLLKVLRSYDNVIVGIVTHRAVLIDAADNRKKTILKSIRMAKKYRENTEDLVAIGVRRSDFDFIVKGIVSNDEMMSYVRVNRDRWSKGNKIIEVIKPITANWHVGKLISLAYVSDIFKKKLDVDIFKDASLITIDDDLLQGHSLVHMYPHVAGHSALLQWLSSNTKDSELVQEALSKIKKFAGLIIPHIKDKIILSFFNAAGAKQFDLPANTESLFFDLLDPLLIQLHQIKSNRGRIVTPAIAPLVVANKEEIPVDIAEIRKRGSDL